MKKFRESQIKAIKLEKKEEKRNLSKLDGIYTFLYCKYLVTNDIEVSALGINVKRVMTN
jgi:hypothetical protein